MPGCADDTPVCPLKISQLAKAPSNLGPQPHHPPSDETPSGLSTVGTLGEGIIPSECPQLEDMVAHQACGHSIHTTNSWGKTPKMGAQQLWKCQERQGGSRHSPKLPAGMGRFSRMAQTPRRKGKKHPPSGVTYLSKDHPRLGCWGWGCVQGVQGGGGVYRVCLDPGGSKRGRGMISTREVTPAGPYAPNAIGPKGVCF